MKAYKNGCLKCLVVALFWLAMSNSYAQHHEGAYIDSLVSVLRQTPEDTNKVRIYSNIIISHTYYKPEQGLEYMVPALALAEQLNWKLGIAMIKHRSARLYWRKGQYDKALKFHNDALALCKEIGDSLGQGRIMVEIGQDYLDSGHFALAKTALTEALKFNQNNDFYEHLASTYDILAYLYEQEGNIPASNQAAYEYVKLAEKHGDKVSIVHAMYLLSANYQALNNPEEALKYLKRGLEVAIEVEDYISQVHFNNSLGTTYLYFKNYEQALIHFSESLALAKEIDDKQIIGDGYRNLGKYHFDVANYPVALDNFLASVSEYKSISSRIGLAGVYAEIGTVLTKLNRYKEAEKYFKDAKIIYDGLNNKMGMETYFLGREKLDSVLGNWISAYRNYKEYIAIRDSTFNRASLQKLVSAELQYDYEKKEMLAKVEQETKDLLVQEEIKQQRIIRNISIIVLLVVFIFAIYTMHQRDKLAKEKKRSDKLLQDNELLLREIHHRVKNNLEVVSSLLALQSAQISDTHTKSAMQESQNRVQSIGIVHQKLYQGSNLGSIEMKDYFLNLSEFLLDSFGAEKRVTIECAMEKLDVDIDTAVPLGLIVNELLTNTLKYAFPEGQSGKVQIKLNKQQDGVLQMEVSDNGVGKSGETKGTGFGGQLVWLLTQQLNGTMKEEVNEGTKIYFEFKEAKAA